MRISKLVKSKPSSIIKPYVIAEIGHNHKGDLKIACKMFELAKQAGADAVKLQKRFNKKLFTEKLYSQPYDNKNSYGKTYGLHREALEFGVKEFNALKKLAKKLKIDFLCTPFDFESLEFLKKIDLDGYKIASADIVHTPLMELISKTKKPIILSTGGATYKDIERAFNVIKKNNNKIIILQCTASYPVEIHDMNLNVLNILRKKFKKNILGLSDHENGIDAGPIAYMLGARVFEKHFTIDRSWKGTDHSFSLEFDGLKKFVRNLNRVSEMLGSKNKKMLDCEINPLYKMRKSIVASKNLNKGTKIKQNDITFKSPGDGLEPYNYIKLLNKTLSKDILKDQLITFKDIK